MKRSGEACALKVMESDNAVAWIGNVIMCCSWTQFANQIVFKRQIEFDALVLRTTLGDTRVGVEREGGVGTGRSPAPP